MLPSRLLLAAALSAWAADPGAPLRVLRATPSGDASPADVVTVSFDRPVAGSLDRSVDAGAIFRIEPAVPGKVEWRDPVTIRFAPAELLTPGTLYTVTIASTFEAMDGSSLESPYRFSFRVRGPQVLATSLSSGSNQYLAPNARFALVTSAPVDLAALGNLVHIQFSPACESRLVRLRAASQRTIGEQDPWTYREAGGWERNRALDGLRRVVEFVPETRLPRGCSGALVTPNRLDRDGTADLRRFELFTYGDFKISSAGCPWRDCPNGPVRIHFTTPVRGAEALRHLRLQPAVPFTVSDTGDQRATWTLSGELTPRTGYAIIADTGLRDVFGQRLTGNPVTTFVTSGYAPSADYLYGRQVVERNGFRTLAVRYINLDTLEARIAPVPDSLEGQFLARSMWGWNDLWDQVAARAQVRRFPVRNERDHARIFGVPLPATDAGRSGAPTLFAVRVTSPQIAPPPGREPDLGPLALVQVTDLGVEARVGVQQGMVWVTGVSDGLPRGGAAVVLHDVNGAVLARAVTDSDGVAVLSRYQARSVPDDDWQRYAGLEGYVAVTWHGDRALVGITQYDPDLSPWRFRIDAAWDTGRLPLAAAVFTERGIYRPGEPVHAKAIIRRGQLGALTPAAGDSLRWVFTDREGGDMLDRTVRLSEFGTSDMMLTLPAGLPLGQYQVRLEIRWRGEWKSVATAGYRVAEYRPPEFLVSVSGDTGSKSAGGRFGATVEARYLFGAPMGRAALDYTARLQFINGWELGIPGTDGYSVGNQSWWWEDDSPSGPASQVLLSGKDTLDPSGRFSLVVPLPEDLQGRPARATLDVVVRDVNRQAVGAAASALVHPASFYLAARPVGDAYFWSAGKPVRVQVLAVRPDGSRVPGVDVGAVIVRREWHRVHRERAGMAEQVGEWVMDTVARCRIATAMEPAGCGFTPPGGGVYQVTLTATDGRGRIARTSFNRWATGPDWVPWNDESQFKMDVVADRDRYSVGDTATVLFAAPFTDAEAWITVEREGILQQRRLRITSGSTTLKFPITEAFAPNAFVSIVVVRGRSAPPGPLDDPGRPTLRVGYAELRVTPEVKRLAVEVTPVRPEYRPGDTVQVRLRVRDADGHGHRSEVTLWAVDEGVLALTGYRTPDPLDLLYRERGLGVRLASNLVAVAPQVPEGEKGGRNPGGGGGEGSADVLRSRFQTTAFFIGSVVTDSQGTAVARARLPDNITTFRVMAVAVTAGDRYGSGESPLLVTRPLIARPALPRFLRAGDRFTAGVVVNQRAGGTPVVDVTAVATGAALNGAASRQAVLESGRGKEIRFGFLTLPGDSAAFRFDVRGAGDADAVRSRLLVQPAYHPRAHTIAGVLTDTASVSFALPEGIDPARSRLVLSLGASPLGIIRGAWERLRVYPYYCSEQVASTALPLIALYRAGRRLGDSTIAPRNARRDIDLAVATLSRRQRSDGGIGYWSSGDWSSPWLSAHAGLVLLEARAAGVAVDDSVIARLGRYLQDNIHNVRSIYTPVSWWYDKRQVVLAEQLAAADLLSRLGRPDVATENELLRQAAQMAWVDRSRLAEVLARRADRGPALALLASVLADVHVEGRRAVLPDSTGSREFYFSSAIRPAAQLLTAVLAADSANPVIGPLVETLVDQGRGVRGYWWNTQDFGSAVYALAVFERRQRAGAARGVEIRAGRRVLLRADRMAGTRDSSVALTDLVQGPASRPTLPLALSAGSGSAPVYFYLTVLEAPLERPVNPDINGITVERWYESYPDGKPVTEVTEGDLVRVRLRLTTPSTRYFVVLDDALPAGLEAIDLSLRTAAAPGVGIAAPETPADAEGQAGGGYQWAFGRWDSGWWSPFDHREIRDDRVVYMATVLWKGSYTATYVARATTPGVFVRPPAWAEEMYNPAVNGRSDGGRFTVNRQE